MRPSAFAPIRPSESEIAAPIRTTVMIAEACVANSAKIQIIGPKPSTVSARRAEDDHRQARGERELGDVEDELDRRQLAVEQQHHDGPDQAGEHEVHRRGEQQAEDERQVAERERVGAAAEVQVDHAALGGEEAQGQHPPRDVDAEIELGQVVHRPRQQRGAGDDDRDIQRPDASCGRQDARRALPRGHGWLIGGASASLKRWTDGRREISPAGPTGAAAGCRRSPRSRRTASRARSPASRA